MIARVRDNLVLLLFMNSIYVMYFMGIVLRMSDTLFNFFRLGVVYQLSGRQEV